MPQRFTLALVLKAIGIILLSLFSVVVVGNAIQQAYTGNWILYAAIIMVALPQVLADCKNETLNKAGRTLIDLMNTMFWSFKWLMFAGLIIVAVAVLIDGAM